MLTRISTVAEERDLGIVFGWDLKFISHVNKIVMKTKRVLGIIKHTFASGDTHTLKKIFFFALVCSPNCGLLINCLESLFYEKHL